MAQVEITKSANVALAAGSLASPEFALIPVPLYRGQRMVVKDEQNSNLRYKFGDSSVTMTINPNTGIADNDGNISNQFIGVPYGASHILVANTSSATSVRLVFASEL